MNQCRNPKSQWCQCDSCSLEIQNLDGMRNHASYGTYGNTLVEWLNGPKWTTIPGFMNVRGECVQRYISSKTGAKIIKIVANGAVSGEIFDTLADRIALDVGPGSA